MGKDFRALIRYHQWQVDEERRSLGLLLAVANDLERQAGQLELDIVAEQNVAAGNPVEIGFTYGAFAQASILRRHQLAAARDTAEEHIAAAQETTRDAYLDLKSFELAQDARDTKETEDRLRDEQATLDELGLEKFRRRES
jgi:flagellar protein FliJ